MSHKVKIAIRGLPFRPRNKGGEYRAGSTQVVDAAEAYELRDAGVADIIEDPFVEAKEPGIPYLVEEPVVVSEMAPTAPPSFDNDPGTSTDTGAGAEGGSPALDEPSAPAASEEAPVDPDLLAELAGPPGSEEAEFAAHAEKGE